VTKGFSQAVKNLMTSNILQEAFLLPFQFSLTGLTANKPENIDLQKLT
jgi:hypothetical protein